MMAAARSLGRSVSGGPAGVCVCVCVCVCAGSHAAAHRAMCALFSLRSARSDWLLVTLSSLRNSPPPAAPPPSPAPPPPPPPNPTHADKHRHTHTHTGTRKHTRTRLSTCQTIMCQHPRLTDSVFCGPSGVVTDRQLQEQVYCQPAIVSPSPWAFYRVNKQGVIE